MQSNISIFSQIQSSYHLNIDRTVKVNGIDFEELICSP